MNRREGGQPGNANALKHGFYSAHFLPFEKKVLAEIPVTELEAEIEALRVILQRFLDLEKKSVPEDFESQRSSLLTACFAASRIASLVRIQSRSKGYLLESSQVKAWLEALPSGELDAMDEKDGAQTP